MATEYKLSYTAAEIDEKLGQISELQEELDELKGEGATIKVGIVI